MMLALPGQLMLKLMLRAWAADAHDARPPGAADAHDAPCFGFECSGLGRLMLMLLALPGQLMLMMFAHLAFNVEGLGR